jgi:hypothetical protein
MGAPLGVGGKVTISLAATFVGVLLISAGLFSVYEKRFFEQNVRARAERILD